MSPEVEKQVYETFRDALREMFNPINESVEKMTDELRGQIAAMRDMASGCCPSTQRAALRRLCEKLEDLIDGRVSGVFKNALDHDIERLHGALEKLRNASNTYAGFLEPYAGFGGTVRLALETGTQPWNVLMGFAGKHPYQLKRAKLESEWQMAFEDFSDVVLSIMLAFESAVSNHTGRHFSFRECYQKTVSASFCSSVNSP